MIAVFITEMVFLFKPVTIIIYYYNEVSVLSPARFDSIYVHVCKNTYWALFHDYVIIYRNISTYLQKGVELQA